MLDKLDIGLDHAPNIFDLRGKLLGASGCNLEYIRNETGVAVILKGAVGDKSQPLYFTFFHHDIESIQSAKNLAQSLINTVKEDLDDFFKNNPPTDLVQLLPKEDNKTNLTYIQNTQTGANNVIPVINNTIHATPTPLQTIQQPPNIVTIQPQAQILQVIPNQQIFLAQDGAQYVQVKVASNPAPVTQIVTQSHIVVPQNLTLAGTVLNVPQLNIGQVQTSSVPVVVQNNISLPQAPQTSTNLPQTVGSQPIAGTVIPPSQWNSEKYDTSEVKYMVTQMQVDNMQWTAQVNSQTTLVQNQQLAYTSQVAASNVQQLIQHPQNIIPWNITNENLCTNQAQLNESQEMPQYNVLAGSDYHNEIISGAAIKTDSLARKASSEDNPEVEKHRADNVIDVPNADMRINNEDIWNKYNDRKLNYQQKRKIWHNRRTWRNRYYNGSHGEIGSSQQYHNKKPFFKNDLYRNTVQNNILNKPWTLNGNIQEVNERSEISINDSEVNFGMISCNQTSTNMNYSNMYVHNQVEENKVQIPAIGNIQWEVKEHPWNRQNELQFSSDIVSVPWQTKGVAESQIYL